MNFLFILVFLFLLAGCNLDNDFPFEYEMIVKEWDRLEDPHSKAKAKCFSKCDDQPADCFYTCKEK